MQIREIMHQGANVINFNQSIQEAAKMMKEKDIGALPVERDDKMVGMFTDRDITVRVVASGKSPKETKIHECMTEGISWCFDDDDIEDVSKKMRERKQRRIPVVNRDKRLVGMVSLAELAGKTKDPKLSHEILSSVAQSH